MTLPSEDREANRVQPWRDDRRYWQYHGKPILLIGASNEDNLFNHPDLPPDGLEAHLDALAAVGGNYVRNTMSSRDEGNAFPFARDTETGLYDLRRLGDDYWRRFEDFLAMTHRRGIIMQIELWDRFDFARECWRDNAFNPKNNSTYTTDESGLPEAIDAHPSKCENPFFHTVPELEDNAVVMPFQRAVVDRMLQLSLPYDNVLYCISNETNDALEWSLYWGRYLREVAQRQDAGIEVTEMWDMHDLHDPIHARTFDRPELFSFVDTSQNTTQIGQAQWDNLQWARERVAQPPRPVNNVKMYGGVYGGGADEGQHKLWRNVIGGVAGSRYHRPGGGIGLNGVTSAHLRSVTMLVETVDIFRLAPANQLLSDRAEDGAYLAADPGRQYALYFPRGGSVSLDLTDAPGTYRLRWLDVPASRWGTHSSVTGAQAVPLATPTDAPWAAVLVRE